MKISIGINIFGKNNRQDLCIDSLINIKNKFDNIILYNIQDIKFPIIEHPDFITIKQNIRTSKELINNGDMNMPIVNNFFDILSELDSDYFVFLNSDIILNTIIPKMLMNFDYDCIPTSRLAINEISNLRDITTHSHYQVSGFDVFAVKNLWWKKNKHRFPDYIYAISAWDVDFATRMMIHGKSMLYNKWPPAAFHIIHPEKSHDDTPERIYNLDMFFQKHSDISNIWNNHLYNILLSRPGDDYITPHDNESELEQLNFKKCSGKL